MILYRYTVAVENQTTFSGEQRDTYVGSAHTIDNGVLTITRSNGSRILVNWSKVIRMEVEPVEVKIGHMEVEPVEVDAQEGGA